LNVGILANMPLQPVFLKFAPPEQHATYCSLGSLRLDFENKYAARARKLQLRLPMHLRK
jgi:hypothetical protein